MLPAQETTPPIEELNTKSPTVGVHFSLGGHDGVDIQRFSAPIKAQIINFFDGNKGLNVISYEDALRRDSWNELARQYARQNGYSYLDAYIQGRNTIERGRELKARELREERLKLEHKRPFLAGFLGLAEQLKNDGYAFLLDGESYPDAIAKTKEEESEEIKELAQLARRFAKAKVFGPAELVARKFYGENAKLQGLRHDEGYLSKTKRYQQFGVPVRIFYRIGAAHGGLVQQHLDDPELGLDTQQVTRAYDEEFHAIPSADLIDRLIKNPGYTPTQLEVFQALLGDVKFEFLSNSGMGASSAIQRVRAETLGLNLDQILTELPEVISAVNQQKEKESTRTSFSLKALLSKLKAN